MRPVLVDQDRREQAARASDRHIVVTAGAGTGKTSLLVERILHLVLEHGAALERIAAITFTEKAAAEMRDRLEEALEEALGLLEDLGEGRCRPEDSGSEAARVLARLDSSDLERRRERALAALDRLDHAAISTIHSFAAELLRRHPLEAGAGPDWEVDEGTFAAELFDELWEEFLGRKLGSWEGSEDREAWRRVLERISMEDLEEAARALCGFRFSPALFRAEAEGRQQQLLETLAGENLASVRELKKAVQGAPGVNKNVGRNLEILEGVFSKLIEEGAVPGENDLEAAGLQESCKLGKKAAGAIPDFADRQEQLDDLIDAAWKLAGTDARLARELAALLADWIGEFREEYLRRGYLSYDAMIILARDLLRDHVEIRREEAARFDHLLIDEFQDTDPLQYEIAFFLAEDPGGRPPAARGAWEARLRPGKLFIVGDWKQSIYRFRGADLDAFERAVDKVVKEGGTRVELQANFRSRPEVLEPLDAVFRELFPADRGAPPGALAYQPISGVRERAGEARLEVWSVGDAKAGANERREAEGKAIAAWIRQGIDQGELQAREVAILLRAFSEVDLYLRALAELGIPYLVEGGKQFFKRLEVELLLSILRAAVNPADAVSLVGWLRSPAAAVPDRELQLHADRNRGKLFSWSRLASPDPEKFPRLSRALADFNAFYDRHRGEPLDSIAWAALRETPLRLAMAASYEGAQKVANLEKAAGHIAQLSCDGRLSPQEILDRIEREDAMERREGDSPLADETLDAVRVMTIHKAKGMEWPVVVVPDLARSSRSGGGQDWISAAVAEGLAPAVPAALALRIGRIQSPACLLREKKEKLHEEAESRRLFYVAATRARERLILVAGAPSRGDRKTWVEALAAWGYVLHGGFPEAESFAGGAVIHRRFAKPGGKKPAREEPAADRDLLGAVQSFDAAREKLSKLPPSGLRRPSEEKETAVLLREGAAPAPPSRAARAAGSAVHLLLELWDRRDPQWLFDQAERAARIAAGREELDWPPVRDQVLALLEEGRRSGALQKIARTPDLARELPLLFKSEDGSIWEGTIDLVAGTLEQPEVVDYKTTAAFSDAELERMYEGQLQVYAQGLQRALGRKVEVPVRIQKLATN